MEECQILRSREAHPCSCVQLQYVVMLTGPSVMDVETKICGKTRGFQHCPRPQA